MIEERDWAGAGTPYVLAVVRVAYGILWLQQTLWKIPPDFGMASDSGLYYWTQEMVKYSLLFPHRFFVEQIVLPHFILFAWLTLLTELFIGTSHVLGIFGRLGALAALAMSTNLLIGLARRPGEWPWSYIMLLGFALIFLSGHPGRILGVDRWLSRRLREPALAWARYLIVLT